MKKNVFSPVTMNRIHVNDIHIAYSEQGSGPPLLLISGLGATAELWASLGLPVFLDAGFRVITFNNRGMEPSDVPEPPYTIKMMADDAIDLIEALGLGPCHICGFSMGGVIVQEVVRRRPDLVRKAVFWASLGCLSVFARFLLNATVEQIQHGGMTASLVKANALRDALTPRALQDDHIVTSVLSGFEKTPAPWDSPGRLGQCQAMLEWAESDQTEILPKLSVPCLAVAHQWDCHFPPVQVRKAAALIPHCTVLDIPDASHNAFNRAHLVAPQIVQFLLDEGIEV